MRAIRSSFRGTMKRSGAAIATLCLASAIVGLSAVPASAATCSGGSTLTIDAASGDSIGLKLSGSDDPRSIVVTPSDPSCGGFDTSSVTTIHVNGTDGDDTVTIDQAGSVPFPHQNTVSIELALGNGSDSVVILGQVTADVIGLGSTGISLDAGTTPDVTGIGTVENLAVKAGGGDDTVSADGGDTLGNELQIPVALDGEAGNDTLTGGQAADTIRGGTGNDTLKGTSGSDTVDGEGGIDVVSGGGGDDAVQGGGGDDRLKAGAGADTMDGGDAQDRLTGGGGADVVKGGDGDDQLQGGAGDDDIFGERGRDQLSGGAGEDLCQGGPDPDSLTGCEHGGP